MPALPDRLADLRARLAAAARRAGRAPAEVRPVIVTKAAPPSIFAELAALGVTDVGENRVQGAAERLGPHAARFRRHFVGSLQGNKVRKALPLFDVFHGVDSPALLARMERVAGELGLRPELLLQVNVSGEASKHGVEPGALPELLAAAAGLEHARVIGLMTMAPASDDPEDARRHFAALARLAREHGGPGARVPLTELSMGMSGDFEVAVEEGATFVRVGRLITRPSTLA